MNSKRLLLLISFLLLLISGLFAYSVENFIETAYQVDHIELKKNSLSVFRDSPVYPDKNDYYLGFETSPDESWQGMHKQTEAFYRQGLKFVHADNALAIPEPQHDFFTAYPDIGSFEIQFFFKAYHLQGEQIIIQRYGSVVDRENAVNLPQGFRVVLSGNYLRVDFEQMFHFKEKRKDFRLNHPDRLSENEWVHVQIQYFENLGELRLMINGELSDRKVTSADGSDSSSFYYPCFFIQNDHPLKLGVRFQGEFDELLFRSGHPLKEEPQSFFGEYVSKVIELNEYSELRSVNIKRMNNGLGRYRLFVRVSKSFFLPDNHLLTWVPVSERGELLDAYQEMLSGKYLQYKLVLESFKADRSVHITGIDFDLKADPVPEAPQIISHKAGEGQLSLTWARNTESDVSGFILRISFADEPAYKIIEERNIMLEDVSILEEDSFSHTFFDLIQGRPLRIELLAYDRWGREHHSLPSKPQIIRLNTSIE